MQVLSLVAAGLTNKEIAQRLVIHERVVDFHVQRICERLGLHRRTELVAWWQRLELEARR